MPQREVAFEVHLKREFGLKLSSFVLQKRAKEVSSSSHTAENSVDSILTSVVVVGLCDVLVGGAVVAVGLCDVLVGGAVVAVGFSDVLVGGAVIAGGSSAVVGASSVVLSTVSEVPPQEVKHRETKISNSNFFICLYGTPFLMQRFSCGDS